MRFTIIVSILSTLLSAVSAQWPGIGAGGDAYGYGYPLFAPQYESPLVPSFGYDPSSQIFIGRAAEPKLPEIKAPSFTNFCEIGFDVYVAAKFIKKVPQDEVKEFCEKHAKLSKEQQDQAFSKFIEQNKGSQYHEYMKIQPVPRPKPNSGMGRGGSKATSSKSDKPPTPVSRKAPTKEQLAQACLELIEILPKADIIKKVEPEKIKPACEQQSDMLLKTSENLDMDINATLSVSASVINLLKDYKGPNYKALFFFFPAYPEPEIIQMLNDTEKSRKDFCVLQLVTYLKLEALVDTTEQEIKDVCNNDELDLFNFTKSRRGPNFVKVSMEGYLVDNTKGISGRSASGNTSTASDDAKPQATDSSKSTDEDESSSKPDEVKTCLEMIEALTQAEILIKIVPEILKPACEYYRESANPKSDELTPLETLLKKHKGPNAKNLVVIFPRVADKEHRDELEKSADVSKALCAMSLGTHIRIGVFTGATQEEVKQICSKDPDEIVKFQNSHKGPKYHLYSLIGKPPATIQTRGDGAESSTEKSKEEKGTKGGAITGRSQEYTEENCIEDVSSMVKDKLLADMNDKEIKKFCSDYVKLPKNKQAIAMNKLLDSKKGPSQSKFTDSKKVSGRTFGIPIYDMNYYPGFEPSSFVWPVYTIASPGLTPYYRKIQGRQGFMDFVTLVANGMKCMARLANHVVVGALHGVGRGELEDTCKGADPGQLDDFVSRHQVQG